MVVDYSKWDKLELSDDSDIEVHPNVDKQSFIRWKQRDLHEKRQMQDMRQIQLELNIETNQDLLVRVNRLLEAARKGINVGSDIEHSVALACEGEKKLKPALATSSQQPLYSDMLESMLTQVAQEAGTADAVAKKIEEHRNMITTALIDEKKELKGIEQERSQHIYSDDMHTGWDSTIIGGKAGTFDSGDASAQSAPTKSSSGASSAKTQNASSDIEVLNRPQAPPKPRKSEEGMEELLDATRKFGEIPKGDFPTAFKYLTQHHYIVTEGQKDALIMSAFDAQLQGREKDAEAIVWNSLLIQYSALLGPDGVRQFFSKMVQANHPARAAFEADAEKTYNHIRSRCKILSDESQEEREQIQLKSLDPNTELLVTVPEEGTEGRKIYDSFSDDVKKAIESRSLDELNEVIGNLEVSQAEDLVDKLSESGVLQVDDKIYDTQQWEQKKGDLEQKEAEQSQAHASGTIDEVD